MKLTTGLASISTIFGALAISSIGCQDPPNSRLEIAKATLTQASTAGAIRYAQPIYRNAESLIQEGWMELAYQNGRLAPLRDYRKADSLLMLATFKARQAQQLTVDSIQTLQNASQLKRRELQDELQEWEDAMNGSLAVYRLKDYWMRAQTNLQISDGLMGKGEYEEALISMAKARTLLNMLGKNLSAYESHDGKQIAMWRRWVNETVAQSRATGGYAVVVDKMAHKTYLLKAGKIVRTFDCELGYNSSHQKLFAGDAATPEGMYEVVTARHRGSKYYKALLINYPNESDKKRFAENKAKGIISKRARIGGWIEIHGDGGKNKDWTEGCVALTNSEMDYLMQYVGVGTPITIVRKSDQWP